MKFTREHSSRSTLLRMSMTPMIDVTFLLLIFFLISTTQAPPESALSPGLQAISAETGSSSDFERQTVEIVTHAGSPAYRVGSRIIRDRETLLRVLRSLPKEGGVFVEGSGGVTTRYAAEALQTARDAGFRKVTYVPVR